MTAQEIDEMVNGMVFIAKIWLRNQYPNIRKIRTHWSFWTYIRENLTKQGFHHITISEN